MISRVLLLAASGILTLACGGQQPPAQPSSQASSQPSKCHKCKKKDCKCPQNKEHKAQEDKAHHPAHKAHQDHKGTHHHGFDNPKKFAERWNSPERDVYQKPAEIIAAMGISPGRTVVDLGSGTGYLLPHLSAAVGSKGKVIAVDVEPAMVEYLNKASKKAGWTNVTVQQGKSDDPGLSAASVDRLVVLNVWHHIANRVEFGKKLAAALRPGGSITIVDFLKEKTEGHGPPMEMRLTAETIADELSKAGFKTEIVEETMPRHYIVRGTL